MEEEPGEASQVLLQAFENGMMERTESCAKGKRDDASP